MAREVTVVLKKEPEPPKPISSRILSAINNFIKSPIFLFVFGTSLGATLPAIQDLATPKKDRALKQAFVQAQADATLIAPFLTSLDATKPGQFEAARAALQALDETARKANHGKSRPVYNAVNKAILAIAVQMRPQPDYSHKSITSAKTEAFSATSLKQKISNAELSRLSKNTLVYIQVGENDSQNSGYAQQVRDTLNNASVLAPGIEKLSNSLMPKQTEVRYFHEEDKPKAQLLASLVSEKSNQTVLLSMPRLKAAPGTLEVWFAGNTNVNKGK